MGKLLRIFALGGNEIAPTGLTDPKTGKAINPDVEQQWRRSAKTLELMADIIAKEPQHDYILVHGNGPQVGNILLRSELAEKQLGLHPLPLDVCGADSQGAIGYMLAQLTNLLSLRGVNRIAAETVTQVLVDAKDEAFTNLTKFIGSAMTKEEAFKKRDEEGWDVKLYKQNDKGEDIWRRVVASPIPQDVIEMDVIESNLKAGIIPIAVGGGGIPVVRVQPKIENNQEIYTGRFGIEYSRPRSEKPANVYMGVEAVIDKDLAGSMLGTKLLERAKKRGEQLDAEFFIITDVDGAKLNYQKPNQVDLTQLSVREAEQLMAEGKFPAGSMGPKIQACINFVKQGGKRAFITRADVFQETLEGKKGTTIS